MNWNNLGVALGAAADEWHRGRQDTRAQQAAEIQQKQFEQQRTQFEQQQAEYARALAQRQAGDVVKKKYADVLASMDKDPEGAASWITGNARDQFGLGANIRQTPNGMYAYVVGPDGTAVDAYPVTPEGLRNAISSSFDREYYAAMNDPGGYFQRQESIRATRMKQEMDAAKMQLDLRKEDRAGWKDEQDVALRRGQLDLNSRNFLRLVENDNRGTVPPEVAQKVAKTRAMIDEFRARGDEQHAREGEALLQQVEAQYSANVGGVAGLRRHFGDPDARGQKNKDVSLNDRKAAAMLADTDIAAVLANKNASDDLRTRAEKLTPEERGQFEYGLARGTYNNFADYHAKTKLKVPDKVKEPGKLSAPASEKLRAYVEYLSGAPTVRNAEDTQHALRAYEAAAKHTDANGAVDLEAVAATVDQYGGRLPPSIRKELDKLLTEAIRQQQVGNDIKKAQEARWPAPVSPYADLWGLSREEPAPGKAEPPP
jgi:hypothetical protein